MKAALILAPTFPKAYPPIGLAALAAVLRRDGHEVAVFDLSATREFEHSNSESFWHDPDFAQRYCDEHPGFFKDMAREILEFGPNLAGFSVWLSNSPSSLMLAKMLKAADPKIFTVFGGPQAGFDAAGLMAHAQVDALVSGEGEKALSSLAGSLSGTKPEAAQPPRGVLLRRGAKILDGGQADEIADLDLLPFPDFSLFPRVKYLSPKMLPISFSRGCLRRCAFCNTASTWRRFRHRSPESIFAEMRRGAELYGAEYFHVASPALNSEPQRLSRLCDLITESGLKLGWSGPAFFSEALTGEFLSKLARAGLDAMDFGLESAAPKVLKLMGKGFSAQTAENNLRACADAGIKTYLNIIIGFPGETEEDLEETKGFLLRNKRWITHIGEPSECIIAQNNLLFQRPELFGVKPDLDGKWATWESADGSNTHAVRQERLRKFKQWASTEGLAVSGPVYKPAERA